MALNFDVSQIKDFRTVTTHPEDIGKVKQRWHPVTDAILWTTMSVGLGTITSSNIDEWIYRLTLLQKISGAELTLGPNTKVFITKEDIEMHIGLATNVTSLSRSKWLKHHLSEESVLKDSPSVAQGKSARDILQEAIEAARCPDCAGSGWTGHAQGGDTCGKCGGSGKRPL